MAGAPYRMQGGSSLEVSTRVPAFLQANSCATRGKQVAVVILSDG